MYLTVSARVCIRVSMIMFASLHACVFEREYNGVCTCIGVCIRSRLHRHVCACVCVLNRSIYVFACVFVCAIGYNNSNLYVAKKSQNFIL